MSDVTSDTDEVYRISVPSPESLLVLGKDESGYVGLRVKVESTGLKSYYKAALDSIHHFGAGKTDTELVLGQHHSGFIGVLGRVGSGSVFFGAGGGVFGESSFNQFNKTANGLTLALNGSSAILAVARAALFWDEQSYTAEIQSIGKLAYDLYLGIDEAVGGGSPKTAGTVSLYGDTAVQLVAPYNVKTAALAYNAQTSGVSTTVSSVVSAGISSLFSSMVGAYTATISGYRSKLIGSHRARLAARHGEAVIEGKRVNLGMNSRAIPGYAYVKTIFKGAQVATEEVNIQSDQTVRMSVGTEIGKLVGAVRLTGTTDRLRMESVPSSLTLDSTGSTLLSGLSAIRMGVTGTIIGALASPLKLATNTAVSTAEATYTKACDAAEFAEDGVDYTTMAAVGAACGAAVGAIATLSVACTDKKLDEAQTGGMAAGTMVGSTMAGSLATMGVVALVKSIIAGKASALAVKLAGVARNLAYETAIATETAGVTAGLLAPMPKVNVTPAGVMISAGPNSISVTPAGISITCVGPLALTGVPVSINGFNQLM